MTKHNITKILIDNRGEIALRILKTCKRLNVGAVVAYSAKDAGSLPVREAVDLGKNDSRYGAILVGGDTAANSYQDVTGVIAAAKISGCDAIHPGYGFLAEDSGAAEAIREADLIFIGPTPNVIKNVGNKSAARSLADKTKTPYLVGSPLIYHYKEALEYGMKTGFPIVLKADASGGGIGNSFVNTKDDLRNVFEDFSLRNPTGFFIEKKLGNARHIELQLAADNYGNVIILGERDCTAQRKSQKVIEESPVTVVPDKTLRAMRSEAIHMAKESSYTGIGTWEFLYDTKTDQYYFLEVNPRIQVEHTVTEMTYEGLDLVEWQIKIASGERLPKIPKRNKKHVMQLRLYGEDTDQDFIPNYGKLNILKLPGNNSDIRVDRGYEQGDIIPAGFDSTIAKIIISGNTREDVRRKAIIILHGINVVGVSTNRDFLLRLLKTDECKNNSWYTTFIDDNWRTIRKSRFSNIKDFIGDGKFAEQDKPAEFDATGYLQDLKYVRRGQKRCYSSDLKRLRSERPKTCGFRYGLYESADGGRFILGYWDFSFVGGTLGSEEGLALAEFFKMAHKNHLPAVTVTTSGGARQQEGVKALEMMDFIMAYRQKYKPSLYINIYSGVNFGGLTVSLAESADISMALTGSKIGFAGPELVARMMGKNSSSELNIGAHSAEDAYLNRNVDVIVEDLNEARERVLGFCAKVDSSKKHPNNLDVFYQTAIPTTRYDRPTSERFVTQISSLENRILPVVPLKTLTNNSSVSQKRAIINQSSRPTSADLLNPKYGIFDSVAPLSVRQLKQDNEEFVPIIGAMVSIGSQNAMFLAQQTQLRLDIGGGVEKIYVAPRANDFRWAIRMVKLANRLHLPIILFDDTTGGDASLKEEASGVSRAISDLLGMFYNPDEVGIPVISINLGENGSGGGLTFGRLMDASADLENALTFVSTPDAQIKILTGSWPTDKLASSKIIDQLLDATADSRKKLNQIDDIIPEAVGGMQSDPKQTVIALRGFLQNQLEQLATMSPSDLLKRRFNRIKRAGNIGLNDKI